MATKTEIKLELEQLFNVYKQFFELIGVPQEDLFKHYNLFTSYKDLLRLNRFFFGGFGTQLTVISLVWEALPPETWAILRATAPTHRQVVKLNLALKELRRVWKQRPKPIKPIKGHEPRVRKRNILGEPS